jgi:low temperature requirement protein LtrA
MPDMRPPTAASVVPDLPIIRARGEERRATFFELFFDLVYVFAVTQLSHHLLTGELTWSAVAETGFMLLAVYWAWNYTTWMANWFDPDTVPVRVTLVLVMLASLLMAVAIPEGFGAHALLFAASYCALQIVRNAFVVAVTPRGDFNRNFRQILAWTLLTTPLWVLGGLDDGLRVPVWLVALGIDLAAPLVRYWVPGVGRTPLQHWQIDGHHFAERYELFVIIALGESIVLAGAGASESPLTRATVTALVLAFLSSTALWWLYFDRTARIVAERIAAAGQTYVGGLGRDVYTYLHTPIVAGIVLTAVGDDIAITHPTEVLGTAAAAVTLAGPVLFLAGLIACLLRIGERPSWARAAVAVALAAALPLAASATALAVAGVTTALLVVLVAVEVRRSR